MNNLTNDFFAVEAHSSEPDSDNSDNNSDIKEWNDLSKSEEWTFIYSSIIKFILFLLLLYIFLLSLNFLSVGCTLMSTYAIKFADIIKNILANPLAGLAIGIFLTALIQNATATTSIAVSMVGAGIIPSVKNAIPIIIGSNLGTCIANSFIAFSASKDLEMLKKSFSAATLNDGFNILTTLIVFPLEAFTNLLFIISDRLTNLIPFDRIDAISKANFMNQFLSPVSDLFILLNDTAVEEFSKGNKNISKVSLNCCDPNKTKDECNKCYYLSIPLIEKYGDFYSGLFWVILSVMVLIYCLFEIVKVLSSLIEGPIEIAVRKVVNSSFPGKFKWLTEIALFLIALFITVFVQSSNIVTVTLVPLCGLGIVPLERVYFMILGANIGTTITGILSAFTMPRSSVKKALQLAYVYTLFNLIGVLLWFPIKPLRLPIKYAEKLGDVVFRYKWFLYVYVAMIYFNIPIILFLFSLIPIPIELALIGTPIFIILITYIFTKLINIFLNSYNF